MRYCLSTSKCSYKYSKMGIFPCFIFVITVVFSPVFAKKYWSENSASDSFDTNQYQLDAVAALTGGVPVQQKCVEIPKNMSLCYDIGYQQMLLPNLLDHDTLQEASEQSASWLPLANIKCHQHTQLFLCSLFAPICPMQQAPADGFMQSDQPIMLGGGPTIYPCRSLCESVRGRCQGVMNEHGFPWPEILDCKRFPLDNDMCISPNAGGELATQAPTTTVATTRTTAAMKKTRKPPKDQFHSAFYPTDTPVTVGQPAITASPDSCEMCKPVLMPKELDAAYCQAQFVAKVRFRKLTRRGIYLARRPRLLRLADLGSLNRTTFETGLGTAKSAEFKFGSEADDTRCRDVCSVKMEMRTQVYLVMGRVVSSPSLAIRPGRLPQMIIDRIMPWFNGSLNRDFRQAEKRLQSLKCDSRTGLPVYDGSTSRSNGSGKKKKPSAA